MTKPHSGEAALAAVDEALEAVHHSGGVVVEDALWDVSEMALDEMPQPGEHGQAAEASQGRRALDADERVGEGEAMMDQRIIRAATNALGCDVPEERINEAMNQFGHLDVKALLQQFSRRWDELEAVGGRGVQLAEKVDSLRIVPVVKRVNKEGTSRGEGTPESIDQLKVEAALLRASLFLAASALKDYRDAKHTKTEDGEMLQLTVPPTLPERADKALEKAQAMLKDEGKGQVIQLDLLQPISIPWRNGCQTTAEPGRATWHTPRPTEPLAVWNRKERRRQAALRRCQ